MWGRRSRLPVPLSTVPPSLESPLRGESILLGVPPPCACFRGWRTRKLLPATLPAEGSWQCPVNVFNPNVAHRSDVTEAFHAGLEPYRDRPDKQYSLNDCISLQTMRREGLTEVLTGDRHLEQEGFRALFRA